MFTFEIPFPGLKSRPNRQGVSVRSADFISQASLCKQLTFLPPARWDSKPCYDYLIPFSYLFAPASLCLINTTADYYPCYFASVTVYQPCFNFILFLVFLERARTTYRSVQRTRSISVTVIYCCSGWQKVYSSSRECRKGTFKRLLLQQRPQPKAILSEARQSEEIVLYSCAVVWPKFSGKSPRFGVEKILSDTSRPFLSSSGLCFKTRVGAQPLIWKSFFILMQIKLIFTRKVVHLASF